MESGGPASPDFYRENRTALISLKTSLRSSILVTYWLVASNVVTSEAAANWLSANPTSVWPRITLPQIIAEVGLPTNYFSYTPYRCLSGVGPGITNEYTQAGGPVLSGNPEWYTRDYGWQHIPAICSKLIVTLLTPTGLESATNYHGHNQTYCTTWEGAKAGAEDDFKQVGSPDTMIGSRGTHEYGPKYDAELITAIMFTQAAYWFPTNKSSVGEYYMYGLKPEEDWPYTGTVFSAVSTALVETNYVLIATDQTNRWGNGKSEYFGSSDMPDWCTDPYPGSTSYRGSALGFRYPTTYPLRGLRRWTPGFIYY